VHPGKTTYVNGGFIPLKATLTFFVWSDVDENGIYDPHGGLDVPLADYLVALVNDDTGVMMFANTSASGIAEFQQINVGNYYFTLNLTSDIYGFVPIGPNCTIVKLSNLTGSTAIFAISTGELRTQDSAGIARLYSSISGVVWEDYNRDGIREPDDVGMSGITVWCLDNQGLLASVPTNSSGWYTFTQLDPGSYGVQIAPSSLTGFYIAPANQGNNPSAASDFPPDGSPYQVTLAPNQQYCCANVGLSSIAILSSTIEGFVWNDQIGDGIQTGNDIPVPGISIILRNGNTGTTISTATSNNQGIYQFTSVAPGTYQMAASVTTYTISPEFASSNTTLDSDFNPNTYATAVFNVTEGQIYKDYDLGLIPKSGGITGMVFYDANGSGNSTGDAVIPNIAISLYQVSSNGTLSTAPLKTTVSSASGTYAFSPVTPSTYQVYFAKPSASWVYSPKYVGGNVGASQRTDSDVNPTGYTDTVTVQPATTFAYLDCGMRIPS